MEVRDATVEDSRAVAEVHVESRRAAWRHFISEAYLDGLDIEVEERWFWTHLAPPQEHWRVLLAEDGDGLLGFVSFRLEPDEVSVGHVGALYVVPERFRSGIGTTLLRAAADQMGQGGAATAFLWVLEEDTRAISFYEARGWMRDGARMTVELDREGYVYPNPSCCCRFVLVNRPTENVDPVNLRDSLRKRAGFFVQGSSKIQASVGALGVVVLRVVPKDPVQVSSAEHEREIQDLVANGANEPLGKRIGLGSPNRGLDYPGTLWS